MTSSRLEYNWIHTIVSSRSHSNRCIFFLAIFLKVAFCRNVRFNARNRSGRSSSCHGILIWCLITRRSIQKKNNKKKTVVTGNADLTNSSSFSIFLERRSREGDEERDVVIFHYSSNTFKHYDRRWHVTPQTIVLLLAFLHTRADSHAYEPV